MTRWPLMIVGAGIVGLTIAAEARRRRPDLPVLVIDKGQPGQGCTAKAGAIQVPLANSPTEAGWVRHGLPWLAASGRHKPLRLLWLVGRDRQAEFEQRHVGNGLQAVPEIFLTELQASFPDLTIPADSQLFLDSSSGVIDVGRLTADLITTLHDDPGVTLIPETAISGYGHDPAGAVLYAGAQRWSGRRAILAPGPWQPQLVPLAPPLHTRVKQVAALHLTGGWGDAPPPDFGIAWYDHSLFLVPLPQCGHWLLSYPARRLDLDPDHLPPAPEQERHATTALLAQILPTTATRLVPGRDHADAYTDDRTALITPMADSAHKVWLAGACHGSGIRLAPGMATDLLDRIGWLTRR